MDCWHHDVEQCCRYKWMWPREGGDCWALMLFHVNKRHRWRAVWAPNGLESTRFTRLVQGAVY